MKLDVKVGAGKLAAGSYDVWLVNLYRDDTGQVIGCSASQAGALTVKSGQSTFRGSVSRYTGSYEVAGLRRADLGPGLRDRARDRQRAVGPAAYDFSGCPLTLRGQPERGSHAREAADGVPGPRAAGGSGRAKGRFRWEARSSGRCSRCCC